MSCGFDRNVDDVYYYNHDNGNDYDGEREICSPYEKVDLVVGVRVGKEDINNQNIVKM